MELTIKRVATQGCEISSNEGIFAWAVDTTRAELIKLAVEKYLEGISAEKEGE